MTDESQATGTDTIDARTDPRWTVPYEELTKDQNWSGLWQFALTAPPIWGVRAVKVLGRNKWKPDNSDDLRFFQRLYHHAALCNEIEIPNPDRRLPKSVKIAPGPFLAARVTADGEYLFAIDGAATYMYIYRLYDFTPLEFVKLDMHEGKMHAVIAFAASESGDKVAVMLHEPNAVKTFIHIYWLEDGEVVKDRWIDLKIKNVGCQVPRLAVTPDGKFIVALVAANTLSIIESESRLQLITFENQSGAIDDAGVVAPHEIKDGQNIIAWRKYGVSALQDVESRALSVANDCSVIVAQRGTWALVWKEMETDTASRKAPNSSCELALSPDGKYLVTVDRSQVWLHDLKTPHRQQVAVAEPGKGISEKIYEPVRTTHEIARCFDECARIVINANSDVLALARSRSSNIRLFHMPDGRNLGIVHGLSEDELAEFRFTCGGALVAVSRNAMVQVWEADGNGSVWPWSNPLISIVHQPISPQAIPLARNPQETFHRGWLSQQESSYLEFTMLLLERN